MIFFLNYKPLDESLGAKAKDNTLNAEDEEKKIKLKIEKYVQKSVSILDVSFNCRIKKSSNLHNQNSTKNKNIKS